MAWCARRLGFCVLACASLACERTLDSVAALEAPTVLVPQLRPREPQSLAWLADDRVVGIQAHRAYVWEPSSGRVLSVERLPDWTEEGLGPATDDTDAFGMGAWSSIEELFPGWFIAPTLDRAGHWDRSVGGLLVMEADGTRRTIPHVHNGTFFFSPDGTGILACDGERASYYDVHSAARVAAFQDVLACTWNEGPVPVVVSSDGVQRLKPGSLRPLDEPFEGDGGWLSSDGRRMAILHADELSVVEVSSRRTLLRHPATGLTRARVVDDAVAYEAGDGGGVLALDGSEILGPTRGFLVQHLGPRGRALRLAEHAIEVVGPSGVEARWADPAVPRFETRDARMVGRVEDGCVEMELQPFDVAVHADCGFDVRSVDEPMVRLTRDGLSARAHRGSIARSDGRVLSMEGSPIRGAAHEDRFVARSGDGLFVRDVDGETIAELDLEEGDLGTCTNDCMIRFSRDGRWVIAARRWMVTAYDASTGARMGRRFLGRVDQLLFFDDDVVAVFGRDGTRSLLDLPSLELRAEWTGARVGRLHAAPGAVIDIDGTRIARWTIDGASLRVRDSAGRLAAVVGDTLVVDEGGTLRALDAALEVRGVLPGRRAVGPFEEAPQGEFVSCDRGHLVRTTFAAGEIRSRVLADVPCLAERVFPLHPGWLLVSADRPLLVGPDDRHAELLVAVHGNTPLVTLIGHGEPGEGGPLTVFGDDVRVLLRRRALTSEGMERRTSSGPVAAWFSD